MPTDASVALWTWLKSIWGTSTGYTVPLNTAIKFDTKFGDFKGFYNYVIIENMPKNIKPQIIGASRWATTEMKRMQILCVGTAAKDTKWKMEQHIQSLINGNVTGLQTTYGIDLVNVDSFQEIPTSETETIVTNLQPNTGFQKARSFATVKLMYESEIG